MVAPWEQRVRSITLDKVTAKAYRVVCMIDRRGLGLVYECHVWH